MARDLTQLWEAIQDNDFVVTIDIDKVEPDGTFGVEASHSNGTVKGSGRGRLEAERIFFTIDWGNAEGEYQGRFTPQGRINGSTFDVKSPQNATGWHSSRNFPA
jgi:hypothetical protein